jgi:leucyl-tRNA synthetase
MDRAREAVWQEAWRAAGISRAVRVPGREKFFALVAYPGASGFLHLGHLRGLAYADALHRYHRMRGRQVFFPTGTHASGLPAVAFARKVASRDPGVVEQLRIHEVPEAEWSRLEDPAYAARFLGRTYLEVFRALGLLIDESAYTTTIDEDYQAFIRWQFGRLERAGVLRQGPYYSSVCPVDGPVSVDPSETDLSKGGTAERVEYTLIPFPLDDGRIFLTATLRPETVFGVTNLWVSPHEPLTVWHHGDRPFLVTASGAELLVEQHGGRIGHAVKPDEIVGHEVTVSWTQRRVPVLASDLVDPAVGTGVVMSVPAHAPVDWIGLQSLAEPERQAVPAVPVILEVSLEGASSSERLLLAGPGVPAERAARATGARSLNDRAALDSATERLYRLELLRGKMTVPPYAGMPVAEARAAVIEHMAQSGTPPTLQQFSEPVVCRNGHRVVIRRIPDQWFIHYGDAAWKAMTRDLVSRMTVQPPEYVREFEDILAWLQDRPCTRQGRWLGTPLPRDPRWIIEPLADSTLYPAYFVVRRFVADGRVPASALTPAFFDYVFLGEGGGEPSLDPAVLKEIRDEFLYWYPLDYNIGGKEHKRVHFPFFLFTHALLLPPELQPRGVCVYWWLVSAEGAKLSKKDIGKKGGAVPPVGEAFGRWGADALRLFYAFSASPFQDVEWDEALVDQAVVRLDETERLVRAALAARPDSGPSTAPDLEAWLLAETREIVQGFEASLLAFDFRSAAQAAYVDLPNRLRRFFARGGGPGSATARVARIWVRLLGPITPHLAEELGVGQFTGLVTQERFPAAAELPASPAARWTESYLEQIEEDLRSVLRAAESHGEIASSVVFYVAAPWKQTVERWLREEGPEPSPDAVRRVVEQARAHPELTAYVPEIPEYVRRSLPQLRSDLPPAPESVDEADVLRRAEGFLSRRFGFEQVEVYPESEAEPHDPKARRKRARPGRPAFYLVTRPGGRSTTGRQPATSLG